MSAHVKSLSQRGMIEAKHHWVTGFTRRGNLKGTRAYPESADDTEGA